jgi:hypothetical protein
MLTLIIYGTVIAGGFTLLLWLPNAVLDFAADKLAEEYAFALRSAGSSAPFAQWREGGVSERKHERGR